MPVSDKHVAHEAAAMFTVISFYTKDWLYKKHAMRLMADCRRLDLPFSIEERQSTGSYLKNTCIKPFFIREKLRELQSPVLWVDCDGSIIKEPSFFYGLDCDFAARKKPENCNRTWHVGTMWFNYNVNVMNFIDAWCRNTGKLSDESALEETWREVNINGANIPPEYFEIIKTYPSDKAVIAHRISSGPSKIKEMKNVKRPAR